MPLFLSRSGIIRSIPRKITVYRTWYGSRWGQVIEVSRWEAKRVAGGQGVTAELVGEVIPAYPSHGKGCERSVGEQKRDSSLLTKRWYTTGL